MIGAISSFSSFNKRGSSWSSPAAFPNFRFCRSFSVSLTEILKSSITGVSFSTPAGRPCHEASLCKDGIGKVVPSRLIPSDIADGKQLSHWRQ